METGSRFAVTLANPLGARQESTTRGASVENIVTAVRQFSESLLINRVSKEVQQEVKALVTHLEVLISRRRVAANKARTPSVTETRVALRNLKRFLGREAKRERPVKTSGSCTTDTLDCSGSTAHALSPRTGTRTPVMHANQAVPKAEGTAIVACCSRGDTDSCCGGQRKLHPATALARDNLLRPLCAVQAEEAKLPQSKQRTANQDKPMALRACQVVRLTCAASHRLLLMPPPAKAPESGAGNQPDVYGEIHVHVASECAVPMRHPAESAAPPVRQLAPTARVAAAPDSTVCAARSRCLLRCRSPMHAERPPFVAANCPLEETAVELAVENSVNQPVLMADASCCHREAKTLGGLGSLISHRGAVSCPVGQAAVAEQGNNCASLSSLVAVVSLAHVTVAGASVNRNSHETAAKCLAGNYQMLSTCSSSPSDDARKFDGHPEGEKIRREESVEIQTSSAAGMVQHSEPTRLGHDSIQAASICLEQRVCESCSPEIIVSSSSITTVDEDPCDWQQPLFRIVDLLQLVRQAAPLTRSGSPTEAAEVALSWKRDGATAEAAAEAVKAVAAAEAAAAATEVAVDADLNANADAVCDSIDCDCNCGGSKPTLELIDQVNTPEEAEAEANAAAAMAEAEAEAATAEAEAATAEAEAARRRTQVPQATPPCRAVTSVGPDSHALGRTWSSCEVGRSRSSGFTKLLLTLDKAAKRRREKARKRRLQQQQQPNALAGTERSGHHSGSHRSRAQRLLTTLPVPASPPPPPQQQQQQQQLSSMCDHLQRKDMALKLAADSLLALSQGLEHCVRRVHEAADAINSSL